MESKTGGTISSGNVRIELPAPGTLPSAIPLRTGVFTLGILRLGVQVQSATRRRSTDESHRQMVAFAIERMRSDPSASLSMDALARESGMSKFHFLRVFQEMTSASPGRFLAAIRLAKAKQLLVESPLPVTTVALESGYTSVATFTRLFTEFVGASPTAFRALYKQLKDQSFPSLVTRLRPPADSGDSPVFNVSVKTRGSLASYVFLGVFSSPIPRRRPLGGTLLIEGSLAQFPIPEGFTEGYLLAAGFPAQADMKSYFLPDESSTVVGAAPIGREHGKSVLSLALEPTVLFNPPIVIALPLLVLNSALA